MNFIDKYVAFTQNQETTERVHRWVAISIVAAALERKVWIHRGGYTLYPNLYTFIVGPSGKVKKSTSTGIGVSLLREVEGIQTLSEQMTAISLVQQLSEAQTTFPYGPRNVRQSALFAYSSELAATFKDAYGPLIELLTHFYDCTPANSETPYVYKTISRGETKIFGPCLNFLGCSTPSWLMRFIPPAEMEGGFASRIIFVVEHESKQAIAWPDLVTSESDHDSQKKFLLADLKRIHGLTGPMRPNAELIENGQKWYQIHQMHSRENHDLRFSGYYARKFDTLLKIATVISVSESSDLILTWQHFELALIYMADVESRMFDAFGGHGENPDSPLLAKLWKIICSHKSKMTSSEIFSAIHKEANLEKTSSLLQHLHAMNRVEKQMLPGGSECTFRAIDPERPL